MTPCIEANGERTRLGYVRVWVDGRRVLAHRLAYEKVRGPIPEGMELDHLCRNRSCCNVEHLEPVTHRVNAQRAANRKLDHAKAAQIRTLHAAGQSARGLGRMFGVSDTAIRRVLKGEIWP